MGFFLCKVTFAAMNYVVWLKILVGHTHHTLSIYWVKTQRCGTRERTVVKGILYLMQTPVWSGHHIMVPWAMLGAALSLSNTAYCGREGSCFVCPLQGTAGLIFWPRLVRRYPGPGGLLDLPPKTQNYIVMRWKILPPFQQIFNWNLRSLSISVFYFFGVRGHIHGAQKPTECQASMLGLLHMQSLLVWGTAPEVHRVYF